MAPQHVNRRSGAPAARGACFRLTTANGPRLRRAHKQLARSHWVFITQLLSPPTSIRSGETRRKCIFEGGSLEQPGPDLVPPPSAPCISRPLTDNHKSQTPFSFPCWNSIEKEDGSVHRPPSPLSLDFFPGKEARVILLVRLSVLGRLRRRLPLRPKPPTWTLKHVFRSLSASSRLRTGSPRPPPKPTPTKRLRSSSPSSPDGKVNTLHSKPKHIFLPAERVASEKKRSASLVKRNNAAVPASAKSLFTVRSTIGE